MTIERGKEWDAQMDAFSQSINGPDASTDNREQCWFPPLILGEREIQSVSDKGVFVKSVQNFLEGESLGLATSAVPGRRTTERSLLRTERLW